jgi:hypothetical protein
MCKTESGARYRSLGFVIRGDRELMEHPLADAPWRIQVHLFVPRGYERNYDDG